VKEKLFSLFSIFVKRFEMPWIKTADIAMRSFSRNERMVFAFLGTTMVLSALLIVWNMNRSFLVEVPAHGGMFTEGAIRSPGFINPLFSTSERALEVDRDLTALIYSGLLRATPNGKLILDLADYYEISPDGLTYTFTLKDNVYWHDGEPITADDIVFTIIKAQTSALKSPKRANWDGVAVEALSDRTVRFILENPYPPFLENMTMGILPKHIWESIDPAQFEYNRYNREPIGSGPYKWISIKRDSNDIPLYYDLEAFDKFALGKPYIDNIRIKFYGNEENLLEALRAGEIDSTAYVSPEAASKLESEGFRIETTPMRHVFGVFLNQNQKEIFTNKIVRRALEKSVDVKRIINEVFYGYATAIDGPLPPGSLGFTEKESTEPTPAERLEEARSLLEKDGWKYDEEEHVMIKKTKTETQKLAFSISTISPSVIPALKGAVTILKENWDALGGNIDVKIFETPGDLRQNAIRPRKYDALLFGEVIGRDNDPYAFWHSSQRLDPGLNIALYTSITGDKLLEEARAMGDNEKRTETYAEWSEELKNDIPAVFLYSPHLIYVASPRISGMNMGNVVTPSERLLSIHEWYVEKTNVWKIFTQ